MPDICTTVSFLADLPLYKKQKPYYIFWPVDTKQNIPNRTTNIQFVDHEIEIEDIRPRSEAFVLEEAGFEILNHASRISLPIGNAQDIAKYRRETEQVLQKKFNAVAAFCYESRIRKNEISPAQTLDFDDPMVVERPASGPHIDATRDSGPKIISDHLPKQLKTLLGPNTRVRIINTWRSMLSVVEDRPLAFIEYKTVNRNDLIPSDRVTPFATGEIYYVRYNLQHKWYWLDSMRSNEPAMFLTYDSHPGGAARYCAHVSVPNPAAKQDAPARQSIETRTIIISNL